ncbi:hypothetical protein OnM2_068015 [Erysiphe neolycopersici]|uniref:Uncharacterized protein n=1 Tax=Erysiphe neolycopersici TaxID=212602 RepID=A0A420HLG0_9PEZI|nr:hypothetical protein OnM2_068015 [Erysiphe neolycopersici]
MIRVNCKKEFTPTSLETEVSTTSPKYFIEPTFFETDLSMVGEWQLALEVYFFMAVAGDEIFKGLRSHTYEEAIENAA